MANGRRPPPFGLDARDARFLVLYLGAAVLMFGALGLAFALPRLLPIIVLVGIGGAYGLSRLYRLWD